MRTSIIAALLLAVGAASPAYANLNVFACEPEWAALATELGGDKVSVYSATTGGQDPHQIQARPGLIARARNADISVCTGAELEIGWLPQIILQTSNQKIRPGAPGAFEASRFVNLLEVPARLDRAEGDIHAAGNPHIQTNPANILSVAKPLADRFAELGRKRGPFRLAGEHVQIGVGGRSGADRQKQRGDDRCAHHESPQ